MELVQNLFWADNKALQHWFSERTYGKLTVVALFILVFSFISFGVYKVSLLYFSNLLTYETFGKQVAMYLIHASLIIVIWLALASAVTASIGILLVPGNDLYYLTILPIKPKIIATWVFIKSVISNFVLMSVVFLPIAIAYAHVFYTVDLWYILKSLLVIMQIVLVSTAFGMPVAILTIPYLRGKIYLASIGAMFVFFAGMIGLLKIIFPPELGILAMAKPNDYLAIYTALPLNNQYFPTYWIAQILDQQKIHPIMIIIGLFVLCISLISLEFQRRNILIIMKKLRSETVIRQVFQNTARVMATGKFPFMNKDFLGIIRRPSESGYILFLFSIAIFFFVFLRFASIQISHNSQIKSDIILFTYGWLVFFAEAILLRFAFPLISSESKNIIILFSLPRIRKIILDQKLLSCMLLFLIIAVFECSAIILLPFTREYRNQLMAITIWVTFCLSVVHTIIGSIFPNFSEGNNPDKVSTSGAGIFALLVSILFTTFGGYLLHLLMQNQSLQSVPYFVLFVCFSLVMILSGFIFARKNLASLEIKIF